MSGHRGQLELSKLKLVLLSSALFLLGAATGAGSFYMGILQAPIEGKGEGQLVPAGSSNSTLSLTGEVSLEANSGERLFARDAEVYIYNVLSPHGRRAVIWFDQVLERMLSPDVRKRGPVEALQKIAVTLYSQVSPLGSIEDTLEYKKHLVHCDSSGRFSISLPAGSYVLIVTGRAGVNEAIWYTTVQVPETKHVSLSAPIAAYPDSPSTR